MRGKFVHVHPRKVSRASLDKFTDLPNIGQAMAKDFELLGYTHCAELKGRKAWILYESLCLATNSYQDPCVLDTFMAVEDFLNGGTAKPWWEYTQARKVKHAKDLEKLSLRFV